MNGKRIDKVIQFIGIFFSLVLFFAIIQYYTFPAILTLSLVSVIVPWLIILNLLFSIYFLKRKKLLAILPTAACVISFVIFGSFYKFQGPGSQLQGDKIEIMSFNVRGFSYSGLMDETGIGAQIIQFVKEKDPDIVCFQEFSRIYHINLKHYPYQVQTPNGSDKSMQVIFSKLPIVGQGSLDFPDTANNTIYADILYKKDTIRVYNAHLQSYKIYASKRYLLRNLPFKLLKKIGFTVHKQQEQAHILTEHRKNSPYKSLICADLNNTRYSSTYRTISSGMNDSFTEAGEGFGHTLNFLNIPMRIDYILSDDSFDVLNHENFYPALSDHAPIIATIGL